MSALTLQAATDSVLAGICLYSGEAEITRVFDFALDQGQNKITILGLPPTLLQDTLRVEGQGRASINDVTISRTPDPPKHAVSSATGPFLRKRQESQKALQSAQEARNLLSTYLSSINAKEVGMPSLDAVLDSYASLCEKADQRILDLEEEVAALDVEIAMRKDAQEPQQKWTGWWQVSTLLEAEVKCQVKLILKYVVNQADWTPTYDIRVDTQAEKDNITIIYKALITQKTGESWQSAPLVLETLTPSFGSPPALPEPWHISIHTPAPAMPTVIHPSYQPQVIVMAEGGRSRSRSRSPRRFRSRSGSPSADAVSMRAPEALPVSDKGGLSATFRIPGLVDIPSDAVKHHVTIAKLTFDARMWWYVVPKVDTRVYLKAKIKNESEYTFVPGQANVFVDGTFVASVSIPSVQPHETFDCPLGNDPTLTLTSSLSHRTTHAAALLSRTRTTTRTYTQRITVRNTKSVPVPRVRVHENVPVAGDERVGVRVVVPALGPPRARVVPLERTREANGGGGGYGHGRTASASTTGTTTTATATATEKANAKSSGSFTATLAHALSRTGTNGTTNGPGPGKNQILPNLPSRRRTSTNGPRKRLELGPGVYAQWDADDEGDDLDTDEEGDGHGKTGGEGDGHGKTGGEGRNGRMSWVLSPLGAMASVSLVLQYEVSYPSGLGVVGL